MTLEKKVNDFEKKYFHAKNKKVKYKKVYNNKFVRIKNNLYIFVAIVMIIIFPT